MNVLITGASSGIGEALAYEYAARGANVALIARRETVLAGLRANLRRIYNHLQVEYVAVDVADVAATEQAFLQLAERLNGIDLVIANAGVSHTGRVGEVASEDWQAMININLTGAIGLLDAATRYFKQRGKGHLAAIASMVAFRGVPSAAVYSATKAGLMTYMEALNAELSETAIETSIFFPGFIATPMVQELPFRPFEISPERCASIIARGVAKGSPWSVVPSVPWRGLMPLLKRLPGRWMNRLT